MNLLRMQPMLFVLMLAALGGPAGAQSDAPKTRQEVKLERSEFLKTHRWDGVMETWVLKPGVEPPAGMKSRADIKAERDKFLSNNRWDELRSIWVPLKGGEPPRKMSNLSRQQARAETRQFLRTHEWDEATETWVEKASRKKRP